MEEFGVVIVVFGDFMFFGVAGAWSCWFGYLEFLEAGLGVWSFWKGGLEVSGGGKS